MIEEIPGGFRLRVLVQPKASKTEIVGPHNGALKIRLQAPPIDGRANEALIDFLADLFDLPKKSILLTKGETSRQKTLELQGLTKETLQRVRRSFW